MISREDIHREQWKETIRRDVMRPAPPIARADKETYSWDAGSQSSNPDSATDCVSW